MPGLFLVNSRLHLLTNERRTILPCAAVAQAGQQSLN